MAKECGNNDYMRKPSILFYKIIVRKDCFSNDCSLYVYSIRDIDKDGDMSEEIRETVMKGRQVVGVVE